MKTMQTLYININNNPIFPSDELVVMDCDLIDDFFFYLGERIGKGCKIQNENALITDFNTPENKQDYDLILSQWNEVKRLLFGEEVIGSFNFELPSGYLHWLRYNEDYNHVYEANFSNGGQNSISIDLEDLYEDSVEALQRKVLRKLNRDDLYLEIDEIVFNDEAVNRKSRIVCAIKEKYEGIGFKAFKKWLQEHEYDTLEGCDVSCDCGETSSNDFFPYKGFVLGDFSFDRINRKDFTKEGSFLRYDIDENVFCLAPEENNFLIVAHVLSRIPQEWIDLLGCRFGTDYRECSRTLKYNKFDVLYSIEDIEIVAVSPSKKYIVSLQFDKYSDNFAQLSVMLNQCPYCKSHNLVFKYIDNEIIPYCVDCNKYYFPNCEEDDDKEVPICPNCSSDNVEDDGSDYLQYECNDCGHNWGHDDTLECPKCGSNDIENDGTDICPYECNACGHIWGEDEDFENDEYNDVEDEFDDDTDNAGNQMSEYLEAFGVVLGKSTRYDLEKLGGEPWSDDPNRYWMRNNRINCYLKDNVVNQIQFLEDSIPEFYRNAGVYWGMNKSEFDTLFKRLGFRVVSDSFYCLAYGFSKQHHVAFSIWIDQYDFHISI